MDAEDRKFDEKDGSFHVFDRTAYAADRRFNQKDELFCPAGEVFHLPNRTFDEKQGSFDVTDRTAYSEERTFDAGHSSVHAKDRLAQLM
jgi:hypothetical protein